MDFTQLPFDIKYLLEISRPGNQGIIYIPEVFFKYF